MAESYTVDVFLDREAGVFVGTSPDIPGLTVEAETRGGLIEVLFETVPPLLEDNLGLPQDAEVEVKVRVVEAAASSPQPAVGSLRQPRYVVENVREPVRA